MAAEEAACARVTRQDPFGPEVQGGRGTGGRRGHTAGDQIRLLTNQSIHPSAGHLGRREKPEGDFAKVFSTDAMVCPLDSLPF